MEHIGILAGDLRQHYITTYLKDSGYNARYLYTFEESSVYVIPVPFTRDGTTINTMLKNKLTIEDFCFSLKNGDTVFGGNIPASFYSFIADKHINVCDFMADQDIVWQNAYLTAEGLLAKIIEETHFSLRNKNILITGFGKCGSLIAGLLSPLCGKIYVYDHTPIHLSQVKAQGFIPLEYDEISNYIEKFNVIINTVPEKIFTLNHYSHISKKCVLFEIASYPFGFNEDIVKKHNLHLITCPGIPGKVSPETAGELISKKIIEHLERTDK